MEQKQIKKLLFEQKKPVFGFWNQLPCPEGAEIAAQAGFDFVIIDGEHSYISVESAVNHIRAIEAAGAIPFMRLPDDQTSRILQALDAGAKGIIIPNITTADQVQRIVEAARFAPLGRRGFCPGIRAAGRGILPVSQYSEWSNKETVVALLIENVDAVKNIEAIAQIKGYDALLLGPYDLSCSMGINGQVNDSRVMEALGRVVETGLKYGKEIIAVLSSSGPDGYAAQLQYWRQKGCKLFTLSSDAGAVALHCAELARKVLQQARE